MAPEDVAAPGPAGQKQHFKGHSELSEAIKEETSVQRNMTLETPWSFWIIWRKDPLENPDHNEEDGQSMHEGAFTTVLRQSHPNLGNTDIWDICRSYVSHCWEGLITLRRSVGCILWFGVLLMDMLTSGTTHRTPPC